MRTMINSLRLLALWCLSSAILATPQQLLSDFQTMRLSATNAVTSFYMFSGLDASSKYERLIDSAMENFTKALTNAQTLAEVNDMKDELASISTDWKHLSSLMKQNREAVLKQGFPEVVLVDEMGRTSMAIVEKASDAYNKLQKISGIMPNNIVQQSRDLALLMQEITMQYAARGTSNLGQVFLGDFSRPISELAEDFQKHLKLLEGEVRSPKTDVLLSNISSKWRFMEERIRDYNQNTVPFLVVSYNDRIIEHLVELEAMYR